ncbi:MAG TPA: NADH-quinone oxidoreductase subunit M [Gemmatimonadaceae bacterium]|nr:NADH-quinone oxidoreductase subunit M [Gemmatimonadaceae bacterium]
MIANQWVLPALLLIPLIGVLVIPIFPSQARWVALMTLLVEFVVSLFLWMQFNVADNAGWQFAVSTPWIPTWGITFSLGIDGVALVMVLLTTFIMPLAILGSWTAIKDKTPQYYALMLVLTTGMLGVFVSLDLFLFYLMWEIMLVPMYFIIGIWGGERRIYASIKFFIYTFLGSLLMLVAILYLGFHAWQHSTVTEMFRAAGPPDFSFDSITAVVTAASPQTLSTTAARWLFAAFFLAFAIKVPMFPFHTWLPDAHVEAPTAGSVILAGLMLKMGTFGFIRLAMPLFPAAALDPNIRGVILGLAVVGIIYGALVALVQPDFKKLVAYSSVSHLGFVMLGLFALTLQSVQGAILVMINHGISTGALFLLVGFIYERKHSRLISAYGGIARVVPLFAAALTFVSLSSIGLPGLNGFVGEFLVLLGSFRTEPWLVLIATTGVIFAAAYMLWAIQRILFNPLDKPENAKLTDLNWREIGTLVPLVIVIIWLGVYPAPVLRRTEASANRLVTMVTRGAAKSSAGPRGAIFGGGGRGMGTIRRGVGATR